MDSSEVVAVGGKGCTCGGCPPRTHHHCTPHSHQDLLFVVVPLFNPRQYKRRYVLHEAFMDRMLREPLVRPIVIECVIDGQTLKGKAHADKHGYRYMSVTCAGMLWAKENLVNLAITQGLRHEPWRNVAWVDGDITFQNEDWVRDTICELHTHDVVQMFQTACDLGPDDRFLKTFDGLVWRISRDYGALVASGAGGTKFPLRADADGKTGYGAIEGHPGYAWACTRRAWDMMGGLIQTAVLGSADRHMAFAWFGVAEHSMHRDLHPNYKSVIMSFQRRCEAMVGRIGFVKGNICHYFHGAKKNRRYIERWRILLEHKFDPLEDVRVNAHGVLEFSPMKPMLAAAVSTYFSLRSEDSIDE